MLSNKPSDILSQFTSDSDAKTAIAKLAHMGNVSEEEVAQDFHALAELRKSVFENAANSADDDDDVGFAAEAETKLNEETGKVPPEVQERIDQLSAKYGLTKEDAGRLGSSNAKDFGLVSGPMIVAGARLLAYLTLG